ncbi:MAG: hypothetical protein V4691_00230 [Pseudomonadota bacterium]
MSEVLRGIDKDGKVGLTDSKEIRAFLDKLIDAGAISTNKKNVVMDGDKLAVALDKLGLKDEDSALVVNTLLNVAKPNAKTKDGSDILSMLDFETKVDGKTGAERLNTAFAKFFKAGDTGGNAQASSVVDKALKNSELYGTLTEAQKKTVKEAVSKAKPDTAEKAENLVLRKSVIEVAKTNKDFMKLYVADKEAAQDILWNVINKEPESSEAAAKLFVKELSGQGNAVALDEKGLKTLIDNNAMFKSLDDDQQDAVKDGVLAAKPATKEKAERLILEKSVAEVAKENKDFVALNKVDQKKKIIESVVAKKPKNAEQAAKLVKEETAKLAPKYEKKEFITEAGLDAVFSQFNMSEKQGLLKRIAFFGQVKDDANLVQLLKDNGILKEQEYINADGEKVKSAVADMAAVVKFFNQEGNGIIKQRTSTDAGSKEDDKIKFKDGDAKDLFKLDGEGSNLSVEDLKLGIDKALAENKDIKQLGKQAVKTGNYDAVKLAFDELRANYIISGKVPEKSDKRADSEDQRGARSNEETQKKTK